MTCGEYAPPEDRWIWPVGQWIDDLGNGVPRKNSTWLALPVGFNHKWCGERSRHLCPLLRRNPHIQQAKVPLGADIRVVDVANVLGIVRKSFVLVPRSEVRKIFGPNVRCGSLDELVEGMGLHTDPRSSAPPSNPADDDTEPRAHLSEQQNKTETPHDNAR